MSLPQNAAHLSEPVNEPNQKVNDGTFVWLGCWRRGAMRSNFHDSSPGVKSKPMARDQARLPVPEFALAGTVHNTHPSTGTPKWL
ncbi:MAG: hypothetical protein WDO73_23060 [Ignavibacteriota bacterium]